MPKLTFYGGVNEIGGNKILVEDKKTRLFFDFGQSFTFGADYFTSWLGPRTANGLGDYFEFNLVPRIKGLYSKELLASTRARDYRRDNALAQYGIQIFRFSNDDVLYNTNVVATDLHQIFEKKNDHTGFIPAPEHGTTTAATLQKSSACFIATAAYGTPMAEEINTLRRFRDSIMEPNLVGRYLIHLYYNTSPPFARVISRSKNMRAFVRMNLNPIIRFLESGSDEV